MRVYYKGKFIDVSADVLLVNNKNPVLQLTDKKNEDNYFNIEFSSLGEMYEFAKKIGEIEKKEVFEIIQ
jgi:hypothetical protein